jgi:hypothetical protein
MANAYPGYNPFTVILCDLATGAFKGQAPFSGMSFGMILNGVGQFSGTVDLADPNMQQVDPLDLTIPNRTALFVDYNGSLVWGGIVWPRQRQMQSGNRTMTVNASSLWSYFNQRVQATDYSAPPYSGITGPSVKMPIWDASNTDASSVYDPLLMAWQIISDAIGVNNGNILGGLGLAGNAYSTAAAYVASGTNCPVANYVNETYPYSSLQLAATIMGQLSQLGLGIGFDAGIDVAYSAGEYSSPLATLNLSYPRRGRTFAQNNLALDLRAGFSYIFPEDGTQSGNVIYEVGASGAISVTENIYPIENGYPVLEIIKSRSQITSANALNLLANLGQSDASLYSFPVVVPQITMDLFNTMVPLGQFIEGDDVNVYIPSVDGLGNLWDPGFPQGMNQEWRIAQWQATVANSGTSTLVYTLNTPPPLGLPQIEPIQPVAG